MNSGPSIVAMMRRLSEIPPELLAEPKLGDSGSVDVAAVVWDVLYEMTGQALPADRLAPFRPTGRQAKLERNRLRLVLLAVWLLSDSWFKEHHSETGDAYTFLTDGVQSLSEYLDVTKMMNDSDRREELIRSMLDTLQLLPEGETASQAADRLKTLDTGERLRVLRAAAAAEQRAHEIREAMRRAKAQDAANRYGE
jgi:hypothetical protein